MADGQCADQEREAEDAARRPRTASTHGLRRQRSFNHDPSPSPRCRILTKVQQVLPSERQAAVLPSPDTPSSRGKCPRSNVRAHLRPIKYHMAKPPTAPTVKLSKNNQESAPRHKTSIPSTPKSPFTVPPRQCAEIKDTLHRRGEGVKAARQGARAIALGQNMSRYRRSWPPDAAKRSLSGLFGALLGPKSGLHGRFLPCHGPNAIALARGGKRRHWRMGRG